MTAIADILSTYSPITLEEMSSIRLMNRIDTKYVLSVRQLADLLRMAANDYWVQEIDGERAAHYRTMYLDTNDAHMYVAHQCGHKTREKIRVRTYVASGLAFLEVKNKNNRGRTDKKRIPVSSANGLEPTTCDAFLRRHAWYSLSELRPQLENSFRRITLVNKAKTERLTIDSGIWFHNMRNGQQAQLNDIVVVELKRNGLTPSPVKEMLRQLRVRRASFSKYCMGCAITDPTLRQNRFKPRLRRINNLR